MLTKYAVLETVELAKLVKTIVVGKCTLILKLKQPLSKELCNSQTLGFRITTHPLAKKLIKLIKVPIVGTSANLSGEPAVCSWQQINKKLNNSVDFIFNGGKTAGIKPSTVLDLTDSHKITVLREGLLSVTELKKIIKNKNLTSLIIKN